MAIAEPMKPIAKLSPGLTTPQMAVMLTRLPSIPAIKKGMSNLQKKFLVSIAVSMVMR